MLDKVKNEQKRKVLVVDDEMINRMMLGNIVEKNYDVLYAENGQEALEIIRQNGKKLSAILLDLMMPVMDGFTLLETLKEEDLLKETPVIVLTSEVTAEVQSIRMGAVDFIKKPYDNPEVILTRIQRIIELFEDRQLIETVEYDFTGLYTKDFFMQYMSQIDEKDPQSLKDTVAFDVEHFHLIREIHGKTVADEILSYIGSNIRGFLETHPGIAGRWDADQFYMYIAHLEDTRELEELLERLNGYSPDLTVRVHAGIYTSVAQEVEEERKTAAAKSACNTLSNNYTKVIAVYSEKLHEEEVYAERLINDMADAMNEKQFKVYMQPKYDVTEEEPRIAGAEALVRWQHPELGMVSPGRFIPLFEGNGLVQRLDHYIWEETARIIADWKLKYHRSVPVSVNVSRIDLYDPEIKTRLLGIIERYHLEKKDLHLEITESAYAEDMDTVLSTIASLQDEGFVIEMDDFGSGFSSLNMLSRMPIDALKFDMQFARTIDTDLKQYHLVESLIGFARMLGVMTIAEGVENKEQYLAMKKAGCDIIQGYYFAKPLVEEEFEHYIEELEEQTC